MRHSLLKLEALISNLFENHIQKSDRDEWISQLVPLLLNEIKINIREIDGEKIAPNIFNIAIDSNCEEDSVFLKEFTTELKIVIDELIASNGFIRHGPLITEMCKDKKNNQPFSISARHSEGISGNTIRISTIGKTEMEHHKPKAEIIFPNGERFIFDSDRITIGRANENDLTIDNLLLSRQHAIIAFTNKRHTITDLDSINGTFVNGNKVNKHILEPGDVITLGDVSMIYINENSESHSNTSMTKKLFRDL